MSVWETKYVALWPRIFVFVYEAYAAGHRWGIFCDLDVNWNVLQSWYSFTYSVECQQFSNLAESDDIVWFEYTDFHSLIDPFTANPGYWQMCVGYIFVKNASSPHRDGVTTDLIFLNMKNYIFPLISNIIPPKVLSLLSPEQHEMLIAICMLY